MKESDKAAESLKVTYYINFDLVGKILILLLLAINLGKSKLMDKLFIFLWQRGHLK
jgi:hypothetical protein